MFRRRFKLTIRDRVRDALWPRSGWMRAGRYLGHRIGRLPGTPYSIAAGFASGAAASMTPFVGFHFVVAAGLAWALRGSLIASAIGTVVGNPWTFPAIWYLTYRLGLVLMGEAPGAGLEGGPTLSHLADKPMELLLPMTAGGLLVGLPVWLGVFVLVRSVVAAYQARRRGRIGRQRAAAEEPMGQGSVE
ncbi:MAG TPA: DUF2062 domain-containing protein [Azospirillaceae bacterium]|nr:DUF2062 domain-containing protein [Azospirillaceae bacterium]